MTTEELATVLYNAYREPHYLGKAVRIFTNGHLLWEELTDEERICWLIMAEFILTRYDVEQK